MAPHITIFPPRGSDFAEEIKCYGLPYGAMGFISHLLTYYVIFCLWAERRPLWPFKRLGSGLSNIILPVLGLLFGVPLAIFTMVRCRGVWQLELIAIWKLTMSVTNGCVGITAALAVRCGEDGKEKTAAWGILYFLGVIIGTPGLANLVHRHYASDQHLRVVTWAFCGPIAVIVLFGCLSGMICCCTIERYAYFIALGFGFFIYALYSDWAIGVMANNIVGLPSSDVAWFYWPYFILARLTMLIH